MRYVIPFLLASTPALAEVPNVVTDIPPVQSLVAQVMGDLGQPVLLLAKGADEHDFQLRPSQAGLVADADLVVSIGPDLTPWLDSALKTRAEDAVTRTLLDVEGTILRPYAGGEDSLGQGARDPHAWLDPANARVWLGVIAADLAQLDPANAATYAANAAAADERIVRLDVEVAEILAPLHGTPIVTSHDAFGYFADRYGLTIAGTIALGDAAAPGAARLAELRATLKAGGVACIFPEVQHDPALVIQLAEGTSTRVGQPLDPVGSSLDPGPSAYAALLDGLAKAIADCVDGA